MDINPYEMKRKVGTSSFQWKVLGFCLTVGAFFVGYIFGIISHSLADESHYNFYLKPTFKDSASSHQTKAQYQLAVGIISSPSNQLRRTVIRQTWLTHSNETKIHYVFIIGTAKITPADRKALREENEEYRDILMLANVIDSYSNLTLKLLNYMKWLDSNVNYTYLLKADDDTFARLDAIILRLQAMNIPKRLYWGFFDGRARVKMFGHWAEKKWMLCDRYLPYAQGGGYVLSSDLVRYIVRNADLLQLYNSEDVSVGVWLAPLKIERIHDVNFDTEYKSRGCFNSYLVTHKQSPQSMALKQRKIKATGIMCDPEVRYQKSYVYNWKVLPSMCCFRNNTNVP